MAKQSQFMASKDRPTKKARVEFLPPKKLQPNAMGHHTLKLVLRHQTSPAPSAKGKEKETTTSSKQKNKGKAREEDPTLPTSFKVVAGSYEKLLYGLDGTITFDEDSKKLQFALKPVFIFPAHVSCIKAVAASPHGGKWLATGSTDEIIKVWDLRRRKEIGGLMHHEEDGTLCLFRARDWAVLRALKGHKGRVNSIAVHPSGKVALSVGKDRALRMWDLMRGKGVASTKLGKEGEIVRWSVDGSKFLVQSGSSMDVYDTNMVLLHTITHPSRIHDVKFCSLIGSEGELLLVAAEDRKLSVYDVPKEGAPTIVAVMTGHQNRYAFPEPVLLNHINNQIRVKAVQTLQVALPEASERTSTTLACTASSDGFINVYDLASVAEKSTTQEKPQEIEPVTSYDSKGTRLTCITMADGDVGDVKAAGDGKRKREEDEEDDDDDDDEIASEMEGEENDEEEEEEEEEDMEAEEESE
ncbi:WD40-repeat-containing domain protein [Gymnopilus junonius]|uniref:WD40-repeat-containing domain protein n=1 Tax=Gymnopilus junonius TaxID=109634 RepID=A0A9P5TPB0_GYMJU|nr:WD40-repeat-containing domain protein [Gymnopilus junonius]